MAKNNSNWLRGKNERGRLIVDLTAARSSSKNTRNLPCSIPGSALLAVDSVLSQVLPSWWQSGHSSTKWTFYSLAILPLAQNFNPTPWVYDGPGPGHVPLSITGPESLASSGKWSRCGAETMATWPLVPPISFSFLILVSIFSWPTPFQASQPHLILAPGKKWPHHLEGSSKLTWASLLAHK